MIVKTIIIERMVYSKQERSKIFNLEFKNFAKSVKKNDDLNIFVELPKKMNNEHIEMLEFVLNHIEPEKIFFMPKDRNRKEVIDLLEKLHIKLCVNFFDKDWLVSKNGIFNIKLSKIIINSIPIITWLIILWKLYFN